MTLRVFSPSEANQTLPLVKRIVRDILALGSDLRALASRPLTEDELDHAREIRDRLHDLLAELSAIGCDYKDWGFELGLVDFPGFVEGRPACLCWRSDEPAVEWYHAPDAGYAGRRRIPTPSLQQSVSE